jgi:hypothetical protein
MVGDGCAADRPGFGLGAIGFANSPGGGKPCVVGVDFRAPDAAAVECLAGFRAHDRRLQPRLRRSAMPPDQDPIRLDRIMISSLCLSMIFSEKPVPTFPDHALGLALHPADRPQQPAVESLPASSGTNLRALS